MKLEGNYYGNCRHCRCVTELFMVPRIGLYCETCVAKLSKPIVYEGAVSGVSMVQIAEGFDVEVWGRTARYRAQAKLILEQ